MFRWQARILHVRGEGDCHRCVRVRVWGAGKNRRALQADLLSNAYGLPWGCATDTSHPTPADLEALIGYALGHGWDPEAPAGTFFLTETEHDLALEDFLPTDRLRDPAAPDPRPASPAPPRHAPTATPDPPPESRGQVGGGCGTCGRA